MVDSSVVFGSYSRYLLYGKKPTASGKTAAQKVMICKMLVRWVVRDVLHWSDAAAVSGFTEEVAKAFKLTYYFRQYYSDLPKGYNLDASKSEDRQRAYQYIVADALGCLDRTIETQTLEVYKRTRYAPGKGEKTEKLPKGFFDQTRLGRRRMAIVLDYLIDSELKTYEDRPLDLFILFSSREISRSVQPRGLIQQWGLTTAFSNIFDRPCEWLYRTIDRDPVNKHFPSLRPEGGEHVEREAMEKQKELHGMYLAALARDFYRLGHLSDMPISTKIDTDAFKVDRKEMGELQKAGRMGTPAI